MKGKGCRFAAAIGAGLGAVKTYFFHQTFYAKGTDQVLNQTSRPLFYFSSSPLPVPSCTNLLCPPFFFSSSLSVSFVFHSAPLLPALQLIWESDPWALRGQVIQGHWQVISADWLTSKRTSGRSQSGLAPSPLRRIPLPSSSAACVTWPVWGVRGRMINDAFSTCLEWSCPHRTVITHSQAAAAQRNCFLFVDLVYWGERWLWLGKMVLCTVYRGDNICMSKFLVSLYGRDLCKPGNCERGDVYLRFVQEIQMRQDTKSL